ncbi:MAG TPA: molecular chaperone HtpG [Candidatus Omnitrophota bacterium]|nr:molecular chaperone HtpG [Candidatus Omnitrophota bacterium]HNQ51158.1 molecular chaperone HtpG [Candidatus Omnitrophota bacterium]HQO37544.1 molecular chaperone HtpG [Candidatus Omnitrophota bacterium]HQQ05464.1 molecular chaperone HtpG [Candidatus Omnitrophota bacterium]
MSAQQSQTFEFKAEMKQLLNIIAHSLYTHPEIFLRELISNASDALNKVRFRRLTDKNILDPEDELQIKIEIDEKKQTFVIEDNGIGMTHEELVNNIGTVARSGTLEFFKRLKEEGKSVDGNFIGQFGVGFYSVFMVTDEVTIETRSADVDSKGLRWKSSGEGTFTIEEFDKKSRGTRISFTLKESAKEFSSEYRVKEIIEKYSNFADFPIVLKGNKINKVTALWQRKADEITDKDAHEFYKFLTNDIDDPLGYFQVSVEGVVNFKALLFVPAKAPFDYLWLQKEKSLHLYSNKILIQSDSKDLLPEYLRFAKGVVDTADLPLNISREVTQYTPVMEKIRDILTGKILGVLKDWAENKQDKFLKFYQNFGTLLKTGLNSDFVNRDKLIELLRFESSAKQAGEMTSLKEYVSRMKDFQSEIYYLSGENRDLLEHNPKLEYFKKNGVEVLFLTEPIDVFTVPSIHEYEKKPIKSIDKADIALKPQDQIVKPDDKLSESLLKLFKDELKGKVEDVVVSKRLVESAATLVSAKDSMDPQFEKMMKLMHKDYKSEPKRIMEINIEHALIKNLSKLYISDTNNPMIRKCIDQLYEGALFVDGDLPASSDFIKRMTDIMVQATS